MRKIKLYIACSVDGYIATKTGDISFLDNVAVDHEDYGYSEFIKTIDTVIMGRKTYDKIQSFAIPFPYQKETVYVFSKTMTGKNDDVIFVNQDVLSFVQTLKKQPGKDIFFVGGASLFKIFNELDLIDEMVISIMPIILGDGIPLFLPSIYQQSLILTKHHVYDSGLVQLIYIKKSQ